MNYLEALERVLDRGGDVTTPTAIVFLDDRQADPLLKAAPAMLAALKALCEVDLNDPRHMDAAMAAIALAEGKS